MAHLPATTDTQELTEDQVEMYENIVDYFGKGLGPAAIAKKVHPKDLKARKTLRRRLWNMVRSDANLQAAVAARAHGHMVVNLLPVVDGLIGRAKRGRPDAAKVILEASGFHNPRIKHEHSGDIKITLDVPRPAAVDTSADEE